jgi:uncharacterized protein
MAKILSVLSAPDEEVVRSVTTDDVVWTFPGSSVISGEAHGVAEIVKRAMTIAGFGVHVEVVRPVYGHEGIAVLLHNTAAKNGRKLDEHLAAVFSFRDGKISHSSCASIHSELIGISIRFGMPEEMAALSAGAMSAARSTRRAERPIEVASDRKSIAGSTMSMAMKRLARAEA